MSHFPCRAGTAQSATALVLLATAACFATPARAATPTSLTSGSPYSGYSSGDVVYANAANLAPDVAVASAGQSAAGVGQHGGRLVTADQLSQRLLNSTAAGRTAYGHGSGVNLGILSSAGDPPQLAETTAEATSPSPGAESTSGGSTVPVAPLLTADVLPGSASAGTTSAGSCVTGKDTSRGLSSIADATVLDAGAGTVVGRLGGTSTSTSRTELVDAERADGSKVVDARPALLAQTTQTLAPLTLFAGTPLAVEIDVLRDIQLSVESGGVPGTSVVSYGAVGATDTTPVLRLTIGGQSETLTSQQVFGGTGLVLPLGVADVVIGAPAHALAGLPGTAPNTSTDGTSTSAAADFVRVTVPGQLPVTTTTPLGTGPLAPLNGVVAPLVNGASAVLTPLQQALTSAGLDLADVRQGHLEAASTVPVGGIDCGAADDPLDESAKDVSARRVSPGATFQYALRVPNRGSQALTGVTASDTYRAGLQLVSADPAPSHVAGRALTFDLGTLQPGEFRTVLLSFRVPDDTELGTLFSNDAVIAGTAAGTPVTHDVSVAGPLVVAAPASGTCDLRGSKVFASNTRVTTGEQFAYGVAVLNSGSAPCSPTVVTDRLPAGTTFVSCTAGCTHDGQTVTWQPGRLDPGASRLFTVVVQTTATSGRLPGTAVITSPGGQGARPSTAGPIVTSASVPAPGVAADAAFPATASAPAAPSGDLPRTGLPVLPALAGVLLLTGAAVLRRRSA